MSDTQVGEKCLVHYNSQHIQVRKDFLDLCAYDKSLYNNDTRKSGKTKRDEPNQECMAKILRLLETLTDERKSHWQHHNEGLIAKKRLPLKEPAHYHIELAYSTIVRLLYSTYGESTIRNSMAALLQMEYVTRYQKNKASVPSYTLNIPLLQAALQNQIKVNEQSEEEVLNVTSSDSDDFLSDSKVLNSTSRDVNVTPKPIYSTPRGVHSTPNNIVDKKSSNISLKESSTALRANNNSPVAEKVKEPFTEREQQIIKWFCEVANVAKVSVTKAAQESLSAIGPEIESIEDMRGLYEQAKSDIAARSDATNKTVYLANLKDALFNWKQNKPVVQPTIAELPALTEQEATQKVLWTRRPSKLRQMIDVGYDSIEDHMKLLEWMPLHEAREYYYGFPGAREYTPEEIEQYEQLAGQQEPKRLRLL